MTDAFDPTRAQTPLEVLLTAALADPGQMAAFEAALLEAEVFAASDRDLADGRGTAVRQAAPDETLNLRVLEVDEGLKALAVFTHPGRMSAAFDEDAPWVGMTGRRLMESFGRGPVLINPADGRGLFMPAARVAELLDAPAAEIGADRPSGEVRLSLPERTPTALIARLLPMLNAPHEQPVLAAWLARADWPATGARGWFLDVRTGRGAADVRGAVGRALAGLNFGDETLDLSVGTSGPDGVGMRLV